MLFPYIFGRTGGAAIDDLDKLKVLSFQKYYDLILGTREELSEKKNELLDLLYGRINEAGDPKTQKFLLNLKRSVFNERRISRHIHLMNSMEGIDVSLSLALNRYHELEQSMEDHFRDGEEAFLSDTREALHMMRSIANEGYIKNGLLFSSSTLYEEINKTPLFGPLNSKERKIAFSILRYFTRSVTKTTPFSSYNSIFCLECKNGRFEPVEIDKSSKISVNNLVFLYLKKLILATPAIMRHFSLKLNSTLKETGASLTYYINQDNNETLKKIGNADLLQFMTGLFKANERIPFETLVLTLSDEIKEASDEIKEASKEQIASIVGHLIDEGFLIVDLLTSPYTKNWPSVMLSVLGNIRDAGSEPLQKLVGFLSVINTAIDILESTDSDRERKTEIKKAHASLLGLDHYFRNEVKINIDKKIIEKISPNDIFYEDTLIEDPRKIDSGFIKRITADLKELNGLLEQFKVADKIKSDIRETLIAGYQSTPVPVLRYFEEVYLKKREEDDKERSGADAALDLESGPINLGGLVNRIVSGDLNGGIVDLREYTRETDQDQACGSFGAYLQYSDLTNGDLCVINNISPGYGKNITRFLGLFSDDITSSLKEHIKASFPNDIICEIKDAAIHNSNIYPRLAESIVDVPGSQETYAQYKTIRLNDIFLKVDEVEQVILVDQNGQKIVPFEFSMENIRRKSSLSKLLELFSPSRSYGWSILNGFLDACFEKRLIQSGESCLEFPRVYFGKDIVIRRKKWLVKKEALLKFVNKKSDLSMIYFFAFQQWQKKNNIPDEIFVQLSKKTDHKNDHYKPQYINFKIPLLVSYFLMILSHADDIVELTEMLPAKKDISPDEKGKRYVKEYILNSFN